MKKFLAVAILATGLLGATSAFAQATASTSASGSVTLIRPLTITKTADLEFGRIVKHATTTGTVSMTSGADGVTAGSGAVALTGITTSRAKFSIDGESGQLVNVTVPASFGITNGTDTITVTTASSLGTSVTLSGTYPGAGSSPLNVGGSFSVLPALSTGVYTGTLNVSVAYN